MSSAKSAKVTITPEAIQQLERAGYELLRKGAYDEAVPVLALVLQFRGEAHMGVPVVFACDVDESAGMAEVVELQKWSVRCE